MEMPFSSGNTLVNKKFNVWATLRGLLISTVKNALPTFVLFQLCKLVLHTSDMTGLIVSALPAIALALFGIARQRRIDLLSGFMIAVIVVSICILLLGGSPRLYLLRESFISIVIGVAYLGSLLFPKPLWFFVGRYFLTGNDPQNIERFNQQWQYPFFRSAMRSMSLMWGLITLAGVVVHIVMVLTLPIALLLIVGSIPVFVTWAVLFGWTGWRVRSLMVKLQQVQREPEPAEQA